MSKTPELGSIVASLLADAGAVLVRRLVDAESPLRIYLGFDPANSQLGVLIAVHRQLIPVLKDIPTGSGFIVRSHAIKEDPKDIVNFGVFCANSAFDDIFLHFMQDLVSHLLQTTTPDAGLRTFLARLSLWQKFFVSSRTEVLSDEAQCGLFAELIVLRDLLIPVTGPSIAVDSWRGPQGSPQDFQLNQCALEVKCTRAKAGIRIQIANEMQLDERPFPHLALIHIAVTVGGGGSPSLSDVVGDLREVLAGTGRPLEVFNDNLILAGWLDAHAARYSEIRYFVQDIQHYEVRDGFPRIRSGDHPAGVVAITYQLESVALKPFSVERSTLEGWLQ